MQRNTIAINYFVTLWNMLSLYLFIPINIRVFGSEAFGVISYAATVQAILSLLDLGISTVLKREFVVEADDLTRRRLLASIEIAYAVLIVLVLLAGLFFAPFVAPALIHAHSIAPEELSACLFLVFAGAVLQVLFMIYQGALWGLGKINQSNGLQFLLSVLKNGAAILFAWSMGASLVAFFTFQLLAVIAFVVFSRKLIYKSLSDSPRLSALRMDLGLLKKKVPFAGGVFLIGVLAAVNAQVDKIILSAKLPIADFAAYSIAFTLSQMPVVLISPMLNVFFPKLSKLMAERNRESLRTLVKAVSLPAFWGAANVACTLFFYRKTILDGWLSEPDMTRQIAALLPFLIVGGLLQSFTVLPYMVSLAAEDTKTIVMIQLATSAFFIPLSLVFVAQWGAIGAALTWCAINCAVGPAYVFIVLKKNMGSNSVWYYARHFGMISMLTLAVYTLTHQAAGTWGEIGLVAGLAVIAASAALSYVGALALLPDFSHQKMVSLFFK